MVAAKTANEQAVLDFFETLSSGDLAVLASQLHEDMSWEPMVRDIPAPGSIRAATRSSTNSWLRCAAPSGRATLRCSSTPWSRTATG
jgi:ketosteroid isomerase-like protein